MSFTTPPSTTFSTALFTSDSLITPSPTAVTTPWVFPTTCTSLLSICSGVRDANPVNSQEYFLCLNELGNRWKQCQPKGSHIPVRTAAVCPSGWWALDVGMREEGGRTETTGQEKGKVVDRTTWSTARCCSSGVSLGDDIYLQYNPAPSYGETISTYGRVCLTTFNEVSASSTRYITFILEVGTSTSTLKTGTGYYPGWSIEWQAPDTSTLSPPWPTLTNNMLIPTWTEGMYIFPGEFDGAGDLAPSFAPTPELAPDPYQEAQDRNVQRTLKIYLPIGIILLIALGLAYWRVAVIFRRNREGEEQSRQGTWSPNVLEVEENARQEEGGTLEGASRKLGGRWWRKSEARKTEPTVELRELEISMVR